MIASHLMLMAELLGLESARRSNESEDRPVSRLGRLIAVIGDRLRQHSPPTLGLSNHMRRDIGLEPQSQRSDWLW